MVNIEQLSQEQWIAHAEHYRQMWRDAVTDGIAERKRLVTDGITARWLAWESGWFQGVSFGIVLGAMVAVTVRLALDYLS